MENGGETGGGSGQLVGEAGKSAEEAETQEGEVSWKGDLGGNNGEEAGKVVVGQVGEVCGEQADEVRVRVR